MSALKKSEIIHVNTLHHLSELTGGKGMLADSPRCRISVKEKLAEMREKAYGQKIPEPDKAKNKEECL